MSPARLQGHGIQPTRTFGGDRGCPWPQTFGGFHVQLTQRTLRPRPAASGDNGGPDLVSRSPEGGTMPKPSVGRVVHYVSYGTPGGEYTSQCRAAIVAAVPDDDVSKLMAEDGVLVCDLVVLNPTGLFFNRCEQDEASKRGGTWHWPERVEE